METLQGIDAMFLALETGTSHLQVGAVLVLDPPEGRRSLFSTDTRYAQIRRVFEQRVHLVRPLRQRAVPMPFGLYQPVWLDDPEFDLDDHVHRASVPEPGRLGRAGGRRRRLHGPGARPEPAVVGDGRGRGAGRRPDGGRRQAAPRDPRRRLGGVAARCVLGPQPPRSGDPVPGGAVGPGADPVVGRAPPARGRRPGPPAGGGPGHAPPGRGRRRRCDGPQPGAGRAGERAAPGAVQRAADVVERKPVVAPPVRDDRGAARRRQARPPGVRVHGERRPPDGDLGGGPRPAGGARGASGRPARRVRPRVDPPRRGRPARGSERTGQRGGRRARQPGVGDARVAGDGRRRPGRTAAGDRRGGRRGEGTGGAARRGPVGGPGQDGGAGGLGPGGPLGGGAPALRSAAADVQPRRVDGAGTGLRPLVRRAAGSPRCTRSARSPRASAST